MANKGVSSIVSNIFYTILIVSVTDESLTRKAFSTDIIIPPKTLYNCVFHYDAIYVVS